MGEGEPPRLPGLELLRPIGRGSFGEVWLARTVTGQYRAVKLVPLGTEGSGLQALGERVFRGVQAYLDHLPPGSPAALTVLHVDRDPAGRFLYYVMELADDVAGGRAFAPEHYQALTLSEFRRRSPEQYVPAPETIRLGRQLADGLATLHAAGLVHRDIKPNNVVFIGGEPRLADIDLVRPAEASLSLGGAQGYSPLEGPGRPAADVFSLGRTLYATVTGLPVGEFPRLPEDWDQRPDAPDLQRLNAVLLRACDRDPARRHPNAAALAEDLQRLERGEDVERDRTHRSRIRRIAAATAALLTLVALATSLLLPVYKQRRERQEFERNRHRITSAEAHLRARMPQSAAVLLAQMKHVQQQTVEVALLERQSDDLATAPSVRHVARIPIYWPTRPAGKLIFSEDGERLAAWNGRLTQIYSAPTWRLLSTITNAIGLVGFVHPGYLVVGIHSGSEGSNSLCLWDSDSGARLPQHLPGNWIPAGILADRQTVVALPYDDRYRTLVRWQPLSGLPATPEVWNADGQKWSDSDASEGIRPAVHSEPAALINHSGDLLLYREVFTVSETNSDKYDYTPDAFDDNERVTLTKITDARYDRASDTWNLGNIGTYERLSPIALSASGGCVTTINTKSRRAGIRSVSNTPISLHTINRVTSIIPNSTGDFVAYSGEERHLLIANVKSGERHCAIPISAGVATALAWGNKDTLLASAQSPGELNIWHISQLSNVPQNHRIKIQRRSPHVSIGRDGTVMVGGTTSSGPNIVGVIWRMNADTLRQLPWAIAKGREGDSSQETLFVEGVHTALSLTAATDALWAISDDGRLVCATDFTGTIPPEREFFATQSRLLFEAPAFTGGATNVIGFASPNGLHLALLSEDMLSTWVVNPASASRIAEISHPSGARFTEGTFSSDSRLAVVLADDGSALLADLATSATRLLKQLNEKAATACFRPDSTECYFGTSGGRLLRLDTATDDPPELLDANFGLPAHMIATPDGERLLTAGPGEQLGIRRLPDGAPIVQLTHHGLALEPGRHSLKRLLYLPKQQRVISLSEDGWLTQW